MYNNPFHIFNELASGKVNATDKDAVKKLKKIYLSKLELSESKTVQINETRYTKNDLINLFEGLENVDELQYYKQIYENEDLNLFLDKKQFVKNIKLEDYPTPLLDLIKRDIVSSFKHFIFTAYQKQQVEKISEMLTGTVYQNHHLQSSLEPIIANICENHIEEVQEMADNSELRQFPPSPEVRRHISKAWTRFYNQLSSNFDVYREDYALWSLNLGSNLFNSGRKDRAKGIYRAIKNIECSPMNKRLIKDNYDIIVGGFGSGIFSNSYVIWVIIFFGVRIMFGMGRCNSNSNHYEPSNFQYNNDRYKEVIEKHIDHFDTSYSLKTDSSNN